MRTELIRFEVEKKSYPLEIIDDGGVRWVPSQQVGAALGTKGIRRLINSLAESGELIEQKHYRTLTVQKSGKGNPNILALSYRGTIRVAMRSEGVRAKQFRDWAEDVLYEVMTTGRYEAPGSGNPDSLPISKVAETFRAAKSLASEIGLIGKSAILAANCGTRNLHQVDVLALLGINPKELPDESRAKPCGPVEAHNTNPQKSLFPENDRLAIYHFENHKIRALKDKSRAPWWVLSDIGKALDYNGIRAIVHRDFSRHTKKEPILTRNNLLIPMTVIDTPGLMEVLQRSVKAKSDSFLDWMTNILNRSPENNPAAAKLVPFRK